MNLCRNGHDKDVVGISYGNCRECKRIGNREAARRRRARGPKKIDPTKCRNGVHPKTGSGPCSECRRAAVNRQSRRRRAKPPVDGWENEFGPCPARVRDTVWVDRVALQRVLDGGPRDNLTLGESRALHMLGVIRHGGLQELESA